MSLKQQISPAPTVITSREKIRDTFQRLHGAFEEKGFSLIRDNPLSKPNEYVYNRGIGRNGEPNGKSNFFVFVKLKGRSLEVMFSNPGYTEKSIDLTPSQIRKTHLTAGHSKAWVDEVVGSVLVHASKKPDNVYFAVLHGHWGSINGVNLIEAKIDDGFSRDFDIIRQMMFYNYDFDGTGHHNHIVKELLLHVKELERRVGITKVPGCELTISFTSGGLNGPHHLLWFANDESALEYARKVLKNRDYQFPAYAASVDRGEILKVTREMRESGLLAVGLAHPFQVNALASAGLLNRARRTDYSFQDAISYIGESIDSIAAFNLKCQGGKAIGFDAPDQKFALELVQKWYSRAMQMTPNVLNRALALEMRERFGIKIHVEADEHYYPSVERDLTVHSLGKMWNVVDISRTSLSAKPTQSELVSLITSRKSDAIYPFMPFKVTNNGNIDLVDSRNNETTIQNAKETIAKIKSRFLEAPSLLHDLYISVKRMFT
ncbi:MAG: hypothetical protein ABIF01_00425 [Candidatus Micrarchaeota archaeon]